MEFSIYFKIKQFLFQNVPFPPITDEFLNTTFHHSFQMEKNEAVKFETKTTGIQSKWLAIINYCEKKQEEIGFHNKEWVNEFFKWIE